MEIRIAYSNATDAGGTFITPVWFGIHDNNFNIFDIGSAASEGLERIAEDGSFDAINAELTGADADAQGGLVTGPNIPPIGPRETGSAIVDVVDAAETPEISFAAMILPSNDAFVGSSSPLIVFDDDGDFLGEQNILLTGNQIYDAGTEVNSELDAAFINQTAPDTGIDQGGVIQRHPGFIGSVGNPASEFAAEILGGETAVGAVIDPVAGDFTIDRAATIGVFHVNEVARFTGDGDVDIFNGARQDDIVDGAGGNDQLRGGTGWDILDGGADNDLVAGNGGADQLYGSEGNDSVRGGNGDDTVSGGEDDDFVFGQAGEDILSGGSGTDFLTGGTGADIFVIEAGAEIDIIRDFEAGVDKVDLSAFGIEFGDLAFNDGPISNGVNGTTITLTDASVEFVGVSSAALDADDFIFV